MSDWRKYRFKTGDVDCTALRCENPGIINTTWEGTTKVRPGDYIVRDPGYLGTEARAKRSGKKFGKPGDPGVSVWRKEQFEAEFEEVT